MKDEWAQGVSGAIVACDANGLILDMNDSAAESYEKDGGRSLLGRSLFDCHPEPARSKLAELLRTRKSNVYTIEKNGVRKLIVQMPWFRDDRFGGLAELSIEIPKEIPHFARS
jgi:hypothetical protein